MTRLPSRLFSILPPILAVAACLLLAPLQVGGQAVYVTITGNSMEPQYYQGDLVILRRASTYQAGDVATYRHPALGPVIHRIIAKQNGRFFFQGDNNDWVDPYYPVADEIIGKAWVHIPYAGQVLETLRTPWVLALPAIAIVLIAVAKKPGQKPPSVQERKNLMDKNSVKKSDILFVLGLLA